jgi:DNA-binding response OmpR family regulator
MIHDIEFASEAKNDSPPTVNRGSILIVEDDPRMQKILCRVFTDEQYSPVVAGDGQLGLDLFLRGRPRAVVLDLILPKISGRELCQKFKNHSCEVPVVVLSAITDVADKVLLLELGADDYVTKPFSPRELIARVKALLRRAEPPADAPRILEIGKLAIDPASYRVSHSGKPVPLSTLEFRLLYYLASRPNRVFTRDQLLDAVWGTDRFVTPRSVDVYVRRLREKIEADPENPLHLKTVRGAGYLFETRAT